VGMIYERRHTREMSEFGGLWRAIPIFTLFFLVVTLSSIGLPGLNGFIGEFLILLGAFAQPAQRVVTAIGATGVILGACYMLWMFQKLAEGPLDNPENQRLRDLSPREICVLAPLVALIFVIGVFPNLFLRQFDQSCRAIVARVDAARGPAVASRPRPVLTVASQRIDFAGPSRVMAPER
jgi:NADH-quinone oxidoreductase subunit M